VRWIKKEGRVGESQLERLKCRENGDWSNEVCEEFLFQVLGSKAADGRDDSIGSMGKMLQILV